MRYAALLSARALLQALPPDSLARAQALGVLLPPLALNRYYGAEGVRAAAQVGAGTGLWQPLRCKPECPDVSDVLLALTVL